MGITTISHAKLPNWNRLGKNQEFRDDELEGYRLGAWINPVRINEVRKFENAQI
jgi:hypothetical protein